MLRAIQCRVCSCWRWRQCSFTAISMLRDRRWLLFLVHWFSVAQSRVLVPVRIRPLRNRNSSPTGSSYSLAHCIYALWIGYGLILGLGFLFPRTRSAGTSARRLSGRSLVLRWSRWCATGRTTNSGDTDFGYKFGYRCSARRRLTRHGPGGGAVWRDRDRPVYADAHDLVESQERLRGKTKMDKYPASETFDRRDVATSSPRTRSPTGRT